MNIIKAMAEFQCRKGGKGHEHVVSFKDAKDFKYVKLNGPDKGIVRAVGTCPRDGGSLSVFQSLAKVPSGTKIHPAPAPKAKKSKKSRKSRKSGGRGSQAGRKSRNSKK